MTERFGLRAVRAIGVAVAGLLLIVGGAFAADQLASAGHDDGLAAPTPVLAPAILDVSGSGLSDDDAAESPDATDDSDDDATETPDATDDSDEDATDDSDEDATESPDATEDSDEDATESPDATEDSDEDAAESPEPSDDAGHD